MNSADAAIISVIRVIRGFAVRGSYFGSGSAALRPVFGSV
jgi:hypothetical protein